MLARIGNTYAPSDPLMGTAWAMWPELKQSLTLPNGQALSELTPGISFWPHWLHTLNYWRAKVNALSRAE